jgi:hypothetical protein
MLKFEGERMLKIEGERMFKFEGERDPHARRIERGGNARWEKSCLLAAGRTATFGSDGRP